MSQIHSTAKIEIIPAALSYHGRSVEQLTWRLAEVARALGVSRRTLERERSAGRFPPPDLKIGKAPLWKPETIRSWVEAQGHVARKGVGDDRRRTPVR